MAVLETKIDRFIGKIEMGKSFFEDAALLLVSMIDEEPDVCERILAMKRTPWLTRDVLDTFESIGRKQLSVEAMFLPKHVLNRLIALPVDVQAQIATEPVAVLSGAARRKTDAAVVKSASQLSRREAAIAIGPNGVRSLAEQAAVKDSLTVETKLVGYMELTMMNGRPFLKRCEFAARAQKVKLDSHGQAILEVVV